MNKSKLKSYAPAARRDFIRTVTEHANLLGLSDEATEPVEEKGDVAIIAGHAWPRKVAAQRESLDQRIEREGFSQVMEAVAYTWFNRFLALRYMELHDYLGHGFRVLSHPGGSHIPEILEQAVKVDLPGLDKDKVIELKLDGSKDAELYRLLLTAQCNALHKAMPFLFEKIDDETELLLPENLLHSDSLVRKLVTEIDEEDWKEVEIIGWLYQFYISEKKDQVIGKVVKSEDIPAATQLFTPNWIVKYMVQNSLGRKWLMTYPDSKIKEKMEYYIEPAEQTEEVNRQLKEITAESLNPEEITVMDPACGSGHILVVAYDVFKEIYLERGYRTRDIPRLILEKNLYGLDIDDRAAQMAGFALLMKARADDRWILSGDDPPNVNVMGIQESKGIDVDEITENLLIDDSEGTKQDIKELLELFENGKIFGSLINIPNKVVNKLSAIAEVIKNKLRSSNLFAKKAASVLFPFVKQALYLSYRYDSLIMNPPYLGIKYYEPNLKDFAKENYEISSANLFSLFMDRSFAASDINGLISMITIHNWMFLSDFTDFRIDILNKKTILSLVHLGPAAFPEITGEVVQSCCFTMSNNHLLRYNSTFYRFIEGDSENKRQQLINKSNFFQLNSTNFLKVEGAPYLYWFSHNFISVFEKGIKLFDISPAKAGLATGDNEKFQRYWFEVSNQNIGFNISSAEDTRYSNEKWFPCNSGGDSIKWYGNHYMVVNWKNNGSAIKSFVNEKGKLKSRPQNTNYYFKEGITWNKLGSSSFVARYKAPGFIFDDTSRSAFPSEKNKINLILALLNSIMSKTILTSLNPSMSFTNWDLGRIPVLSSNHGLNENVTKLVDYSKSNWDSFETSWDFQSFPWLTSSLEADTTDQSFQNWDTHRTSLIKKMQELETENNRLFIEAYGLEEELTPEVPEDQITFARADREEDVKRLLSYSVGCMMGRYSLDEPGLIYAHSGNEGFDQSKYKTFPADDDGIVPIMDMEWFDDDAAARFDKFINVAWSPETLEENLKFIAESLSAKKGEAPRDTIRRYFSSSFFKDHLKTYKKRPIYWLFSSGKLKAFECLVYLHRHNESTLSRMRNEYATPLQGKFTARADYLQNEIDSAASASARNKLQKQLDILRKKQAELKSFDDELRHYADQRIKLDLDDGVKVNYGKFGNLLVEVNAITGKKKK